VEASALSSEEADPPTAAGHANMRNWLSYEYLRASFRTDILRASMRGSLQSCESYHRDQTATGGRRWAHPAFVCALAGLFSSCVVPTMEARLSGGKAAAW
jgi:hypothetical protein